MDYQFKSILRGEHSIYEQIKAQGVDPVQHVFVFNLRSYDRLNTTPEILSQEEKSGLKYKDIQNAEAEEIMGSSTHHTTSRVVSKVKSESSSIDPSKDASSDDTGDLKKEQAVDQKRQFQDHKDAQGIAGEPESFEGQGKATANTVGQSAMLKTKSVSDEHWFDGHEDLERDNFIQEELYIHAKVMIVDDRIAICGSSNINDRSQIGTHDSELSMVIEDTNLLESTMDGKPFQAGRLPATLRRRLWREHLGLLPPQDLDGSNDPNAQPPGDSTNDNLEGEEFEFVADPLSDKVWDMWTTNATTNTNVFRELFRVDPDNSSTYRQKLSLSPILTLF
jgi:phospholipase D1/2